MTSPLSISLIPNLVSFNNYNSLPVINLPNNCTLSFYNNTMLFSSNSVLILSGFDLSVYNFIITNISQSNIAYSNSCKYITITIPNYGILVTSNNGITWNILKASDDMNLNWNMVAMSPTGNYQTIITDNEIYCSSDYGTTFTMSTDSFGNDLFNIQINSTGQNQYVISTNTIIYSADYGVTWQVSTLNNSNSTPLSISDAILSINNFNDNDQELNTDSAILSSINFGITWSYIDNVLISYINKITNNNTLFSYNIIKSQRCK